MKTKITFSLIQRAALLVLLSTFSSELSTWAQGTAFTYQGRLTSGTGPANGSYDLTFALFSTNSGAGQVGNTVTNAATAVTNGLFTVILDFGANFPGADRWLEIGVRTNGTGTFSTLSPRQKITPTPYAIYASGASAAGISGTIPAANLTGTYGSAVTFNNPANSFSGNGTGLTNVNAISLGGFGAASFWNLGGNTGTTPGAQFLGTTDNLPLEFKVNGTRALRLEPNPNAPNVIGGSIANVVTNGNYGAVIAGGGSAAYPNRVGAIYATVVGGSGNTASGNSATAMGQFNTASGYAGTAMGYSTVAGGFGSQAGGTMAKANHDGTFVWADNTFVDFASTAANQFLIRAAGGVGINTNNPNGAALAVNGNVTVNNTIGTPGNQALELKVNNQRGLRLEPTTNTDTVNVIGGSARNFVSPGVAGATIGGGGAGDYFFEAYTNQVEADFGTVSGGAQNTIQTYAQGATIGGGRFNMVQTNAYDATLSGGRVNTIQSNAYYTTIGGGAGNTIQTDAQAATIGGGQFNVIQEYSGSSTIGGGYQNTIQYAPYATIGGGLGNTILPGAYGATIPGGLQNSAFSLAFAAGRRAKANHTGAFVWGDSTDADFASTADNQFLIRASGGVGIGTGSPGAQLDVASSGNTTIRISGPVGGGPGVTVACEFATYNPGLNPPSAQIRATDDGNWSNDLDLMTKVPGAPGNALQSRLHIASGGNIGIGTPSPTNKLHVIGGATFSSGNGGASQNVVWTPGSAAWSFTSDRNTKEKLIPVDGERVLEKVAKLPLSEWSYIGYGQRHIGPMAQDFHAHFPLNDDDKSLNDADLHGVALAAIQGLNQKVEMRSQELEDRSRKLEAENAELRRELAELKASVQSLAGRHDRSIPPTRTRNAR